LADLLIHANCSSCCAADKGTERERLFEGASTDSQPKLKTADEIKAKYRKEVIQHERLKCWCFVDYIFSDMVVCVSRMSLL
jgi:hypothetical protein